MILAHHSSLNIGRLSTNTLHLVEVEHLNLQIHRDLTILITLDIEQLLFLESDQLLKLDKVNDTRFISDQLFKFLLLLAIELDNPTMVPLDLLSECLEGHLELKISVLSDPLIIRSR